MTPTASPSTRAARAAHATSDACSATTMHAVWRGGAHSPPAADVLAAICRTENGDETGGGGGRTRDMVAAARA
eukprot:5989859-Pleurochrysis_carterae.AAC.1